MWTIVQQYGREYLQCGLAAQQYGSIKPAIWGILVVCTIVVMEGYACSLDYNTVIWNGILTIWATTLSINLQYGVYLQYGRTYLQYGLLYSSMEGYTCNIDLQCSSMEGYTCNILTVQ